VNKLFKRHIANLLPKLKWRHFGTGALQAYLHEGGPFEQRLHIWHDSLIKPGILGRGNAHNHRFSFVSQVLCGAIEDTPLSVVLDERGNWDVYEVENARKAKERAGAYECKTTAIARAHVTPAGAPRLVHEGQSYEVARGAYSAERPSLS